MTFKIIKWLNHKTKSNTEVQNIPLILLLQERKWSPYSKFFPNEITKNIGLPTAKF